jgi:hypothetical protein
MIDQNLTENKICLVNGRTGTIRESNEPSKIIPSTDPWVRRCDPSISTESITNLEQHQPLHRQKSIQYETRPYYRSLSSTSDDCLSQLHRHPLVNTIDKDIEYVESRLRGQTTISLPNTHSATFNQTINWRPISNRNYPNEQKYSDTNPKAQMNGAVLCSKASVTSQKKERVKNVKRRIDKLKDQKAAKTLR